MRLLYFVFQVHLLNKDFDMKLSNTLAVIKRNKIPSFILSDFTMLHCIIGSLVFHVKNITLNASIADLIISFYSSIVTLASNSLKVSYKSLLFLQFVAANFFD